MDMGLTVAELPAEVAPAGNYSSSYGRCIIDELYGAMQLVSYILLSWALQLYCTKGR